MGVNLQDIEPFGFKQINTGLRPNDGQGDTLPNAFNKINDNFNNVALHLDEKLSINRTYYVSPVVGNPNNSGLTQTDPLSSIQSAINAINKLNINNKTVVIQLLDGVYKEQVTFTNDNSLGTAKSPNLIIKGNSADKSLVEVHLDYTKRCCILLENARVLIQDITFKADETTSANANLNISVSFVHSTYHSLALISNCVFDTIGSDFDSSHLLAERHGTIEIASAYQIIGGARQHLCAKYNSYIGCSFFNSVSISVTFSNFSSFITALYNSTIDLNTASNILFLGSASGNLASRDLTSYTVYAGNLPTGLSNEIIQTSSLGVSHTTNPSMSSDDTRVPTTNWVQLLVNQKFNELASLITSLTGPIEEFGVLPVGATIPYAGSSAPTGFLLCHGQAISRSDYASLFNVIGTTYGIGDGTTTFNIPDTRGRSFFFVNPVNNNSQCVGLYPLGYKGGNAQHRISIDQMPNHSHEVTVYGHTHSVSDSGHSHTIIDNPHSHAIPIRSNTSDSTSVNSVIANSIVSSDYFTSVESTEAYSGINTTQKNTANLLINKAHELINIQETGGNTLLDMMPPFIILNSIIKY
jgi:microcystin-dependent protein